MTGNKHTSIRKHWFNNVRPQDKPTDGRRTRNPYFNDKYANSCGFAKKAALDQAAKTAYEGYNRQNNNGRPANRGLQKIHARQRQLRRVTGSIHLVYKVRNTNRANYHNHQPFDREENNTIDYDGPRGKGLQRYIEDRVSERKRQIEEQSELEVTNVVPTYHMFDGTGGAATLPNPEQIRFREVAGLDITKYCDIPASDPEQIRFREVAGLDITKYCDIPASEWCRDQGTCAFDWLMHRYGKTKGLITICQDYLSLAADVWRAAYWTHIDLGADLDDADPQSPKDLLARGPNTLELAAWCEHHRINMTAFDARGLESNLHTPLMHKHHPRRVANQHAKSLMFIIMDDHFHPITEVKSVAQKLRDGVPYMIPERKEVDSVYDCMQLANNACNKKKKKKGKKDTENKKEETEAPPRVEVLRAEDYENQDRAAIMVAIMEREKELPTTKDIYMNNHGLMGFKLRKNATHYKFDELDHDIDKLMSEHTDVFGEGPNVGHNVHSMIRGLVQHVYKELLAKAKNDRAVKLDWNKAYWDALVRPMEEFMLFHVIDDWVEFELDATRLSETDSLKKAEEIELGMYWLADNCDDDRLLVRSGLLVPSEVIRFALRERVPFRVSHAIHPSNQLPKDYFVRFEDQLLKLYKGDHNVAKIPMLTFIGTLGKHTQQSWTMHISESMPVVFDYLVTKEQEGWQTYWYPVPDTKYYTQMARRKVVKPKNYWAVTSDPTVYRKLR
eukprot:jgi/Chrzof1/5843/Cz16g17260.t1